MYNEIKMNNLFLIYRYKFFIICVLISPTSHVALIILLIFREYPTAWVKKYINLFLTQLKNSSINLFKYIIKIR